MSKKKVSWAKREAVFLRDGYRCRGCGTQENLTIDHIVPRSKGGRNGMENLQTLCLPCNREKGEDIG